jgi:hypothetical protein
LDIHTPFCPKLFFAGIQTTMRVIFTDHEE